MAGNILMHNIPPTEMEKLRAAAQIAAARTQFLPYVTYLEPKFETPIHVKVLASYLEAVERGDIKRLIITEPPRHGKSYITSGMLPAWCIGRDVSRVVMLISHSADLAETFSIQNRDTILNNPRWNDVFPNVHLKPTKRGASMWAVNNQRENLIANGVMGGLTGYGAWLIIFDDPVKTFEQAQSQAYREKVFNEYKSSARTRLTPDGRIIIIMTRWHEEDLVGKIIDSPEGEAWTVLHLPSLSYGLPEDYERLYPDPSDRVKVEATLPVTAYPDPLNRPKGEPLWPDRWTKDFLEEQRILLGHQFECLYQGNPSAPEGNTFKREWFRPITRETLNLIGAKPLAQARSYDLAFGGSKRSDYTAGVRATLYKVPDVESAPNEEAANYIRKEGVPTVILVVEDVFWERNEWDVTSEHIVQQALEDGEKYRIYVEGVAAQNIGWKSLRSDKRLWKHGISNINATQSKTERNTYAVKLGSAGLIYVQYQLANQTPSWERSFVDELASFPAGRNDDQHDALTQLVNRWQPLIDENLEAASIRKIEDHPEQKLALHSLPMFQDNSRTTWVRDKLGWA